MKILMVCLGNICRSPLAEGILRHMILKKATSRLIVDSAGTGAWHIGKPPDARAQNVAKQFGVDISDQRARQFGSKDFHHFDKIFVMDTKNYQEALALATCDKDKEKIDFLLNMIYPGENRSVLDPWSDDALFEPVYKQIEKACEKIVSAYASVKSQI